MAERNIPAAPNDTNPALVMMGVNLTWIFFVLWAMYGLGPVLLLSALIHHAINLLDRRRP